MGENRDIPSSVIFTRQVIMRLPIFEISETSEHLTSHSGLAMIGALTGRSGLRAALERCLPRKKSGSVSSADALVSMMGLLSLAKPDFGAIERFREDDYFRNALGLSTIPSEGTLRQRMNEIGLSVRPQLLEAATAVVSGIALGESAAYPGYVPIDADVSPFDNSGTKKEGVSYTYKKVDGYAPMLAYIGTEGYVLNGELREGSQHCQCGTPEFLQQTLDAAHKVTDKPLLLRLDAGNDAIENIRVCRRKKVDYVIKRNIRNESEADWLEEAQAHGEWRYPREGKTVYVGDTHRQRDGLTLRVVFQVTERSIDSKGQVKLVPEIDIETYWTSLGPRKASPDDVINIYHEHGTSEQFHSELKTDMGLERMPSGKFDTNALLLTLAIPVFNMLRLSGQVAMTQGYNPRKKVQRRRLRTVIQDLMYMAARVVRHARRLGLAFSVHNPLRHIWAGAYQAFAVG